MASTGSTSDPGAFEDVADAVVLINAHSNQAAIAIATELSAIFNGTVQVPISCPSPLIVDSVHIFVRMSHTV